MAVPVDHHLAEVVVFRLGDDRFAEAEAAGDENAFAFLLDDDAEAADVGLGVFDVDVAANQFYAFGEFEGVVVELAGVAGLEVGETLGGEERGVDFQSAGFVGQGDAGIAVNNGVGFPFEGAVDVDGRGGYGLGIGFLVLGEDGVFLSGGEEVFLSEDGDFHFEGAVAEDIKRVVDNGGGEAGLVEHGGEEASLVEVGAAVGGKDFGGGGDGVVDACEVYVVEVHVVDHPVADGGHKVFIVVLAEAVDQ